MSISDRYDTSGGAYGLYDNAVFPDLSPLGFLSVSSRLNSGLGNTLIVDVVTGSGIGMEVYFGPQGEYFKVSVKIDATWSGNLDPTGLAGLNDIVAGVVLTGDGFAVQIPGMDQEMYTRENMDKFVNDLINYAAVSPEVAEQLKDALVDGMDKLDILDETVDNILDDMAGDFSPSNQLISIPVAFNHDHLPTAWIYYERPWTLIEMMEYYGTEQANGYIVSQQGGEQTIYDNGEDNDAVDRIFLDDLLPSQVSFSRNDASDLVISVAGGGSIVVNDHFLQQIGASYTAIEEISFSDGTVLDYQDISDCVLADSLSFGAGGSELLNGTSGADRVDGLAGDDTLVGARGNDTLVFRSGNDVIRGSGTENYGNDVLDLRAFSYDDVTFSISGHDVVIETISGSVRLEYQVRYEVGHERSNIESIRFADGIVISEAQVKARALSDQSSDGSDSIVGTIQADTFYDGLGNDTISGGGGNDVFVFHAGNDVIVGRLTANAGFDTLDLSDFTADELTFSASGYDVLVSTPVGTIRLEYQSRYAIGHERGNIESILLADGVVLDDSTIRFRSQNDGLDPL